MRAGLLVPKMSNFKQFLGLNKMSVRAIWLLSLSVKGGLAVFSKSFCLRPCHHTNAGARIIVKEIPDTLCNKL